MSEPLAERPTDIDPAASQSPGRPEPEPPEPTAPQLADFEVLKLIGQGTFGSVWLAKERITGVYRAVKILPDSQQDTEITGLCEYQRRALSHPHLVQVFLAGRCALGVYVVLELADDIKGNQARDPQYYEPCSLDRVLSDRGALRTEEGLARLEEILEGLEYLHSQGLVHRDIKPSNVLFVGGQVKLCDFGLVAPGHQAVERAGTHGYWRPDGPTDRHSDLYAVTKVAYQMFTGSDVSRFPELPSDLARVATPQTYRAIKELLDKGCSPNPERRFSSARAMLSRVRAISGSTAAGTAGHQGALAYFASPWNVVAVLLILALSTWLVVTQWAAAPFEPLAEMNLATFPVSAGNPNSLAREDPEGLLKKLSRVVSTSNPRVPDKPIRYANVHLVSNPPSYMLVLWISPTGYITMNTSEAQEKNFRDPGPRSFRSLDGYEANYIICAFMNDRPFMNKDGLKAAIERLVQRYRDDHPGQKPLPQGVMRLLNAGGIRLVHHADVEPEDYLRSDFGLLGEIWLQYGNSYPIVGVELPLPSRTPET